MTSIMPPICLVCQHLHRDAAWPMTCEAFLVEIPSRILLGEDLHQFPIEGDQGLLFTEKTQLTPGEAILLKSWKEVIEITGNGSPYPEVSAPGTLPADDQGFP